ncbi:hypothetical protein A1Q1_00567 [Trichosporon asahii var. asahii CBS 2479]|uniref:Uncharacterized protein n=1 Tax=Trichosporon asahii var. asahii (strain ATCC 90039 / CBS 2479 / JCM 2466 / KCTC 7840 / NBRC 103889/ NCYC 2677 / UAMH 7654) TaxID=1186058 RepID=J4UFF7_TRIAS|nr:hypothetical protein A1Q1_00567 [Trichosporon asahii var. asahii CBS 2479]EJT50100.1 hypothetical protein A1Q1_00567 [Trichosporon asahii var. asahii CBS 2479]
MPAIRNERSSSARPPSISRRPSPTPASATALGPCPCHSGSIKPLPRKREVRVRLLLSWQSYPGVEPGLSDPHNLIQADLRVGKGHETLNLHRKRSLRRAFVLCCLVKGLGVRSTDIVTVENEEGKVVDRNEALSDILGDELDDVEFFVTFRTAVHICDKYLCPKDAAPEDELVRRFEELMGLGSS